MSEEDCQKQRFPDSRGGIIFQTQKLMVPKNHSLLTMDDFYALERDSQDILFIGGSHVVNGIEPRIIENITGLKTMSCAIIGQQAPLHVDYMKEALRYQTPELLVVDIYRFRVTNYDEYMPLPDLHESINGMRIRGVSSLKTFGKIPSQTTYRNSCFRSSGTIHAGTI